MTMTDEKPPEYPPLNIGLPETYHKDGPLTRAFVWLLYLGKTPPREPQRYHDPRH